MKATNSIAVFHGGPGLSPSYFEPLIDRYEGRASFLFHDSPGCSEATANDEPTLERTVELYSEWFADLYNSGVRSVVAHSWGAYVLYRVLAAGQFDEPIRLSLWNPVPLDRKSYDQAVARLVERVTPEVSAAMTKATAELGVHAGQKIMELAWEFYSPGSPLPPSIEFGYFESTFDSVAAGLDQFDLWAYVRAGLPQTEFVFGTEDYILPEDFSRSLGNEFEYRRVPGGHFAFVENPDLFNLSLDHLLLRQ